jgi:hydrogen cyanide synthase HcnB
MATAIAAAENGARVTVIDENAQPGGQIYRQSAIPSDTPSSPSRGDEFRQRLGELADQIEILSNTRVWGIFDSKRLAISDETGWRMLETDHLALAPGAYELTPPFPGWTLPGVCTPGAAQSMVKSHGVRPGRRALIVGTGPFLLVAANHLHQAGTEVVAVVDTVRRREVFRKIPDLMLCPKLLYQGWELLRRLKQAGIPLITGNVIVNATGDEEVEGARIAPCDDSWRPNLSKAVHYEVDTLCVGYGFVPRIQLAQLAGCALSYNDDMGGWIPNVDENYNSSIPGIWCVGDGAGVAGSLVAELEGAVAGHSVAMSLGAINASQFDGKTRSLKLKLRRLRRFRKALDTLSRPRIGLTDLANNETLVCRCEELTLKDIRIGVEANNSTMRELKMATRLGMGPCQGRICGPSMARWIAATCQKPIESLGPLSVRQPIDSITLGDASKGPLP